MATPSKELVPEGYVGAVTLRGRIGKKVLQRTSATDPAHLAELGVTLTHGHQATLSNDEVTRLRRAPGALTRAQL